MTAAPLSDVTPPQAGLAGVVRGAWPLLVSIFLMMTGSGLQGTLLGVRAEGAGFNSTVTGLVLGLYYLGYIAGSTWTPGLVRSVGHIRVFSALVSVASAAVVVHGVWVAPVPWVALRFLTGVCVAGLFVVSESWLNDVASGSTRATLLAVYNTVVTAGLATGSLLLNTADTTGVVLFVAGSVLLSIAAVPVTLAPHEAPVPEAHTRMSMRSVVRSAPLGIVGGAMSGLGTGAALGFGAVYATRAGFGVSGASTFVAALLVGAGAFSLYGLSFAHMADYIEPSSMISAGSTLIKANGLGAASGPLLASFFIGAVGPEGLFELLAGASVLFSCYVVVRLFRRAAPDEERRAHYVPVATGATEASVEEIVSETVGVEPDELENRVVD